MNKVSILGAAAILCAAALPGVAEAQAMNPVDEARSVRLAGEPDHSLIVIEAWLIEHPDDADAWLEKGFAQIAVGDFAGARVSFDRTLQLSPNYDDAHLGLARLDFFGGQHASALRRLAARQETAESRALLDQIHDAHAAESQRPVRADVSAEYSQLSGDLPDWTAFALSFSSRVSGDMAVTGTVEHTRRFERDDVFAQFQVDQSLKNGWSVYGGVGGTVDADFRPRAVIFAGGEVGLTEPGNRKPELDATLYVSTADYTSGQVTTFSPGLAARVFDNNVTLRGRIILLSDEAEELRTGYAQEAALSITPELAVHLGWSDAPETSDGQTLDVRSTSLALKWAIVERIGVTLGAVSEERSAYDRRALIFSINRVFR
jgi:YaiO family outer membrane protein